mmetsp:Transcript_95481/g.309388  ORF Transcript_95481/g.309388 Transcript_95481/m.309388 type:complete len:220 (+) Transcript_95481:310-969(+)
MANTASAATTASNGPSASHSLRHAEASAQSPRRSRRRPSRRASGQCRSAFAAARASALGLASVATTRSHSHLASSTASAPQPQPSSSTRLPFQGAPSARRSLWRPVARRYSARHAVAGHTRTPAPSANTNRPSKRSSGGSSESNRHSRDVHLASKGSELSELPAASSARGGGEEQCQARIADVAAAAKACGTPPAERAASRRAARAAVQRARPATFIGR